MAFVGITNRLRSSVLVFCLLGLLKGCAANGVPASKEKGSDQPQAAPAAPELFTSVDVVVVFMCGTLQCQARASKLRVSSSKLQHVDKPAGPVETRLCQKTKQI